MRAKEWIERSLVRTLRYLNTEVSRSIGKAELDKFFSRTNPVSTQCELIRLGSKADGGYLIPDDLEGIEACFSPGVSAMVDFELDLAKRGIRSYLADFSVNGPPVHSDFFEFNKKFLGSCNKEEFFTLDTWIKEKQIGDYDLILQMDIEGSEYDVIFQADRDLLRRFRIMVIEFHRLDRISNPFMFKLLANSLDKILNDFEIVHIHPNNCAPPIRIHEFAIPPVMEFSFFRRDRIKESFITTEFPHRLDHPNIPTNKDFSLPKCWRGNE